VSDTELGATLDASGPGGPRPDAPELPRGTTLGRYVVLKPLGHGGMGVVYLGFDGELDRRVAIKVLRTDVGDSASTSETRARLLREAQAMAKVSHANVISVFDVGTFGDQVFVAMEYVQGHTLRDWQAGKRPREILDAYVQAGRGLEAAHAAGILHRDFKPDNVLVDGRGHVKVLDFGLARLEALPGATKQSVGSIALEDTGAHRRGALETPLTVAGAIVGTPDYMGPEQLAGDKATARTDQFSFCVALYEALYGHIPFEGKTVSDRASNIHAGRVRPAPPGMRVPRGVRVALLRGMNGAQDQRFPSMRELLDALGRGMHTPGRWLAAGIVGTGVAAMAALLVLRPQPGRLCRGAEEAIAPAWSAARSADVERAFRASGNERADEAFAHTRDVLDRYARSWVTAHTDACEATRVRGEQSEQALDLRVACLRQRGQELEALVDLFASADTKTVDKSVQAAATLAPVEPCSDVESLRAPFAPPGDAAQARAVEDLRQRLARVDALLATDRNEEALASVKSLVDDAHRVGYRPAYAEALFARGLVGQLFEKAAGAEPFFFQAAVEAEAVRHDVVAAKAWAHLAYVRSEFVEDPEGAARYFALADAAATRANSDILRAEVECQRGTLDYNQGELGEARSLFQQCLGTRTRVLGPTHPDTIFARQRLADTLWDAGDIGGALPIYEAVLATRTALFGPTYTLTLRSVSDLGLAKLELGDPDAALSTLQKTVEHPATPRPYYLALFHSYLAQALVGVGRIEEAKEHFAQTTTIWEKLFDQSPAQLGSEKSDFARALVQRGVDADAEVFADAALATPGMRDQERGAALGVRALCKARRGDVAGAIDDAGRALAAKEKFFGERADLIPLLARGLAYLATHREADALVDLERAVALADRFPGDRPVRADARFALAQAQLATRGDRDQAAQLAQRAAVDLDAARLPDRAKRVRAWLSTTGLGN